MADCVKALAQYSNPNRYRYAAWFLQTDGPLREELAAIGVDSAYRPWRGWRDVRGAVGAGNGLARGGFHVVHRHTGGRSVGSVLRVTCRAKVVTHLHGTGPEDPGHSLERARLRPGTDYVIANSRAHAPMRGLPFEVIHPGTETARFGPRPARASGGAGDAAVVGAASRLVPVKAVHDLLAAFALVREALPGTRLEIAGDGPERARLEARARQLGVDEATTFLGWRTDLDAVMRQWTVFAQPSLAEGFGVSALDAMASGLPVVATDVGGVRDLVVDGVTGTLVPAGDPAAMAKALTDILRSPNAVQQLGEAGRARAVDEFDVRQMVDKVTGVYERVLAGAR